ncbi:MAG: hypothetical protein ACI8ZB_002127 [Desulforhopalus sp.]|jgi:hypothetical protein
MRPFLIYLFLLPLVASCSSRIPEPITYPYSQQQKMQASGHWEILAQDLANRINNELILSDNIEKAVYVKPTCGDETSPCEANETSTFNEAFRDLLITGLYDYGIPTQSKPNSEAIEVLYKVQVVRHNSNRIRSLQPGILTTLSTAVLVLRNAPSELILLATGIAADVANSSYTSNGHYEVIITTSMIEREKYLFRASDIYYINDRDFYQYQESHSETTPITLKSKQSYSNNQMANSDKPFPAPPDPLAQPTKQELPVTIENDGM